MPFDLFRRAFFLTCWVVKFEQVVY